MEVFGAADRLGIKRAECTAERFHHVVEGRTMESEGEWLCAVFRHAVPVNSPDRTRRKAWLHGGRDDVRPSFWPQSLSLSFSSTLGQGLLDETKCEASAHISENAGSAQHVAAQRTGFDLMGASKGVRPGEFESRPNLAGAGKTKISNVLSILPIGRTFLAGRQELTEPAALGKPWRSCF
ncbi:hypothetical protein [Rhizobium sp. H4]|uniref:hypothetical protein n=1 Tax=Rhizobium sp. H4 TaxID=2035449 RepID=UPI001FDF87A2|nr:hypothetical protein [Rhizobium sp. H4]